MSQYSDEFENVEDLEDLDFIISRTSHSSNQNNNNETDAQYDDDSFSHINFLKTFNKIREELKRQYLIIQNLNISFITLEHHNLKPIFQQSSRESKIKLSDTFEEKIFEYNIFISQYLLIFHIYSIIYNDKKNENKILFVISYLDDTLRK